MKINELKFGDVLIARNGCEYVVFDSDGASVALSCRKFNKDYGGQTFGTLIDSNLLGKDNSNQDIVYVYRTQNQGDYSRLFYDKDSYKTVFTLIYEREDKLVSFTEAREYMKNGGKAKYKAPNGDDYIYEMRLTEDEWRLDSVDADLYSNFFETMLEDVWVLIEE